MARERRVLRWVIPVDDQWHRIDFDGSILHVASRDPSTVEIWTTEDVMVQRVDTGGGRFVSALYTAVEGAARSWEYRVFGTGQPVDDGLPVGTALAAGGALVWHVFKREVAS